MQFWNTETQNEFGKYYRPEDVDDWAEERPDDWSKPNFTNIRPPHKFVDWDGSQWVPNASLQDDAEARVLLDNTDKFMIRVIGDLIKTLVQKGVISIDDLPAAAVQRYQERKAARQKLLSQ